LSQRHAKEKLQPAAGDVVAAPTRLLVPHQVQQVLPRVLAAQLLGRALEVLGKLRHRAPVGLDRVRREVAQGHVIDHPPTKWGHRIAPDKEKRSMMPFSDQRDERSRSWRRETGRTPRPPRSGLVQRKVMRLRYIYFGLTLIASAAFLWGMFPLAPQQFPGSQMDHVVEFDRELVWMTGRFF